MSVSIMRQWSKLELRRRLKSQFLSRSCECDQIFTSYAGWCGWGVLTALVSLVLHITSIDTVLPGRSWCVGLSSTFRWKVLPTCKRSKSDNFYTHTLIKFYCTLGMCCNLISNYTELYLILKLVLLMIKNLVILLNQNHY